MKMCSASALVLWILIAFQFAGCGSNYEKKPTPRAQAAGAGAAKAGAPSFKLNIVFDGAVAFVPEGRSTTGPDQATRMTALLVEDRTRTQTAPVVQDFLTYVDTTLNDRVPNHVPYIQVKDGTPCGGTTGPCTSAPPTGLRAADPYVLLVSGTASTPPESVDIGGGVSFPDHLAGITPIGRTISSDCYPSPVAGCAALVVRMARGSLSASGSCETVHFEYMDSAHAYVPHPAGGSFDMRETATWSDTFQGTEVVVRLVDPTGTGGPAFRIRPDLTGNITLVLMNKPLYDIDHSLAPKYNYDLHKAYHFGLFYSLDSVVRPLPAGKNSPIYYPYGDGECKPPMAGGKPYCSTALFAPPATASVASGKR